MRLTGALIPLAAYPGAPGIVMLFNHFVPSFTLQAS
jgi:hypothetical protein